MPDHHVNTGQISVIQTGFAILEVVIEQLSPGTYDVEGVVDALQKNHPSHLGPNTVSANQVSLSRDNVLYCTLVFTVILMIKYLCSLLHASTIAGVSRLHKLFY